MDTTKKMRLSTGTVVEDVIFRYARVLENQTPAHSFIVDPLEIGLQAQFEDKEWEEILAGLDRRREAEMHVEIPKCLQWVPDTVRSACCYG
jgi:hypothetical protein